MSIHDSSINTQASKFQDIRTFGTKKSLVYSIALNFNYIKHKTDSTYDKKTNR